MGPGDVLEVSVYGEESLNRKDLVVRPDGRISFPLIGDAKVGGLTTAQAKEVLEKSLHEYIRKLSPQSVNATGEPSVLRRWKGEQAGHVQRLQTAYGATGACDGRGADAFCPREQHPDNAQCRQGYCAHCL